MPGTSWWVNLSTAKQFRLEKKGSAVNVFKECLISKDLQINKRNQTPFWSAFIGVLPLNILKRYCNTFGTWSSPSTTCYNFLTKQGSNLGRLVALIFPPEFDMWFFFFFWSRWYQINDRKQPSATVQKNSCSVGLQSGPFDHSPKEMYVEDFSVNKFVNLFSKL